MTPGTSSPLSYTFDASSNLTTLPTGASSELRQRRRTHLLNPVRNHHHLHLQRRRAAAERRTGRHHDHLRHLERRRAAHRLQRRPAANMTAATYDGERRARLATTGAGTQNFTWNAAQRRSRV